MTRAEEILALCRQMGAGEEQDELLLPLIEAVSAGLERRLKPGVAPEDCGSAFLLAAALFCLCLPAVAAGGFESFIYAQF